MSAAKKKTRKKSVRVPVEPAETVTCFGIRRVMGVGYEAFEVDIPLRVIEDHLEEDPRSVHYKALPNYGMQEGKVQMRMKQRLFGRESVKR